MTSECELGLVVDFQGLMLQADLNFLSRSTILNTYLTYYFVSPARIIPQTLNAVSDIKISEIRSGLLTRTSSRKVYLATLTGFPLLRASSSASSCASRSMRSASLFMSLERSNPVTFFPQVVLNAWRAAATATSISLGEATLLLNNQNTMDQRQAYAPATTDARTSSVAGLIALRKD